MHTDRPLRVAERAAPPPSRFPVAYRRLLVPLGTGAETAQAMSVACRLAADRRAAVIALTRDRGARRSCRSTARCSRRRRRPGGAPPRPARSASSTASAISAHTLRARSAGEAIVEEAARAGVDAIVIGAPRKQRTGTRAPIFGRTVEIVLKRAPCRVIVAALPVAPRRHAGA